MRYHQTRLLTWHCNLCGAQVRQRPGEDPEEYIERVYDTHLEAHIRTHLQASFTPALAELFRGFWCGQQILELFEQDYVGSNVPSLEAVPA